MPLQFDTIPNWQTGDNYLGADMSKYKLLVTRIRDAETLQESNYRVAKRRMEAVAEKLGIEIDDSSADDIGAAICDARFNHWAVGWYECLLIREDAPDEVKLEAMAIWASLRDYPILDDEDYSALCDERRVQYWGYLPHAERLEYCRKAEIDGRKARCKFPPLDVEEYLDISLNQ